MSIIAIFVPIMFCSVFILFIVNIVKNMKQSNYNNHQPRLIVDAVVVAKRMDVHRRNTNNDHMVSSSSTSYYVTFEFETGDRLELKISGTEYGFLVEQDNGKLTFQGNRYLGFERY